MKSTIKKTWIAIVLIWTGALLLTYWNTGVSSQIQASKKRKEIFMKDHRFRIRNADIINRVIKADTEAYHQPASFQIGLLQLRDQLRVVSDRHQLKGFRTERRQISDSDQGEVMVDIFFEGSLEHAYQWLNTVQKQFRYLSVIRFKVISDGMSDRSQFHLSINYRYRILAPSPA